MDISMSLQKGSKWKGKGVAKSQTPLGTRVSPRKKVTQPPLEIRVCPMRQVSTQPVSGVRVSPRRKLSTTQPPLQTKMSPRRKVLASASNSAIPRKKMKVPTPETTIPIVTKSKQGENTTSPIVEALFKRYCATPIQNGASTSTKTSKCCAKLDNCEEHSIKYV